MLSREEKIKAIKDERLKLIKKARKYFYIFCRVLEPKQYSDEKEYLRLLCNILQLFMQGELKREDGHVYKNIIINMPPRFYKTRTFILLCQWWLGQSLKHRFITTSYNNEIANSFSRYTRDGIQRDKNLSYEITYADIFPETKIQKGNSSLKKWALEGEHFSYLGAGKGGTMTGIGCTDGAIDDLIKNAYEAMHDEMNENNYSWFTDTFMSRLEEGARLIIINSRWSVNDLTGKILDGPDGKDYYVFNMPAMKPDGTMLCESVLSRERFEKLKRNMDPQIFNANFLGNPFDVQGRLYSRFKTYKDIPRDKFGIPLFERIFAYCDTADEGPDYLCVIIVGIYKRQAWILDVYYTDAPMEETEPETAKRIFKHKVKEAKFESNNGGRGFARAVEKELIETHKSRYTEVLWFHQQKNKMARILSMASYVMNNIFFPDNWKELYPEFYEHITTFQRKAKNKFDDAPDTLTGIAEEIYDPLEPTRVS